MLNFTNIPPNTKIIELGGGDNPLRLPIPHVNVDTRPSDKVHFQVDFEQTPWPISSDEWDLVVSVFMFEHISWRLVPQALAEVFRITKPGGRLVLVLPDTEAQMRSILRKPGWDGDEGSMLFGGQDYGENAHKSAWSPAWAQKLLTEAGFVDVLTSPYTQNPNTPPGRETDMVVDAKKPVTAAVAWSEDRVKEIDDPSDCIVCGLSTNPRHFECACPRDEVGNLLALSNTVQTSTFDSKASTSPEAPRSSETPPPPRPEGGSSILDDGRGLPAGVGDVSEAREAVEGGNLSFGKNYLLTEEPTEAIVTTEPEGLRDLGQNRSNGASPTSLFNHRYFDNYQGRSFFWDYPKHQVVASKVLERKPVSVLELGCARGYVLKRVAEKVSQQAVGLDVSRHCQLTRVTSNVLEATVERTRWSCFYLNGEYDLCYSISFLEHLPEQSIPMVIKEMARISRRGLHAVTTHDDGTDPTRVTVRPLDWWKQAFQTLAPGWPVEIFSVPEFEAGPFPPEVLAGDRRLKLNLGCAWTMFHYGWTNVDVLDLAPFAQANGYNFLRADLRQGLPFATGVVDLLFMSHVLEHLSYREGLELLRELRRLVRKDGALRILVPDAGMLTCSYGQSLCWDTFNNDNNLAPPPKLEEFDEVNRGCAESSSALGKLHALLCEGHSSLYDADTLLGVLEAAGWNAHVATVHHTRDKDSFRQLIQEVVEMDYGCSLVVDAVPRLG